MQNTSIIAMTGILVLILQRTVHKHSVTFRNDLFFAYNHSLNVPIPFTGYIIVMSAKLSEKTLHAHIERHIVFKSRWAFVLDKFRQ